MRCIYCITSAVSLIEHVSNCFSCCKKEVLHIGVYMSSSLFHVTCNMLLFCMCVILSCVYVIFGNNKRIILVYKRTDLVQIRATPVCMGVTLINKQPTLLYMRVNHMSHSCIIDVNITTMQHE